VENWAIDEISASVQLNCFISDARYGSEYGLCTYLLKMREYFRWERGLGCSGIIDKNEMGEWLSEREQMWKGLEGREFGSIKVEDSEFDPFNSESINALLNRYGLVYSGGIGRFGRPHFFLGELERRVDYPDYTLLVSGREFARDLTAPPAMTRDRVIYVRRESLRQMLWEKLESWRWHRPDTPLGRAFSYYAFDTDLDGSLDRMTDDELNQVLLHERGECIAGDWLGDEWNRMIADLTHTPAELAARAVRDHLADCWVTLPETLERGRESSLHFFVGNLNAMRKTLFPGLRGAYDRWFEDADISLLEAVARAGLEHWKSVARAMLELHAGKGERAAAAIAGLAEKSSL
jgi:hypothetical protein